MARLNVKRRDFLKNAATMAAGSLTLSLNSFTLAGKKISLIGDSIRMGYQWQASLFIKGEQELWGPEENTLHTVHLLANAHKWVKNRPADIIHLNSGLHDIKCIPYSSRKNLIPVEQYAENIERIIKYIHQYHAEAVVILATSTPVMDDLANAAHAEEQDFSRYNEDVVKYNEKARKVVTRLGVPVNDLYEFVISGEPSRVMKEDGIHFNEFGNQLLGEQVANAINVFL